MLVGVLFRNSRGYGPAIIPPLWAYGGSVMAMFDGELAVFVEKYGEKAVLSAFNAYTAMRDRQVKYAAKYADARKVKAAERKANNAFAKEIAKAAATPEGAEKVRALLAARGINL